MDNDTCVKYSMAPHALEFVSTHTREILVWTILSRILHLHAPNILGMNGDVKSYLSMLEFNNGE